MKYSSIIITFLFLILANSSFAQLLGLKIGMQEGKFFDRMEEGGYNSSEYSNKWGYHLGIQLSKLKVDSVFSLRFGVMYEEYGGGFKITTGSHTNESTVSGSALKRNLCLQFYPINATWKSFSFGAGLQTGMMLSSTFSGVREGWSGKDTITTYYETLNSSDFLKCMTVATVFYVNYEIKILKGRLGVEYSFIWNFSNEFIPYSTQSYRNQLGLVYSFYSLKK